MSWLPDRSTVSRRCASQITPTRSARSTSRPSCNAPCSARRHWSSPTRTRSNTTTDYVDRTTSYIVALFGAFGPGFNNPERTNDKIYYFAGDVNFGRAMKKVLLRDGVADRIVDDVLALTGSRPLIVNLEGVMLPNVPEAIDDMTLAMSADLAIGMLKRLHVAGVSLANNHAYDLGPSGYAETVRALAAAGIPAFRPGRGAGAGRSRPCRPDRHRHQRLEEHRPADARPCSTAWSARTPAVRWSPSSTGAANTRRSRPRARNCSPTRCG